MLIGLCGKSGSGKSTIAKMLSESNEKFINVDIDTIGHNALMNEDVKEELVKNFGKSIILENEVSRKILGDIVFASRYEMEKLSLITWKYMEKSLDEIIERNKNKIIILDWILLPESKYFNMCDIKILIDVPYEIRKERAIKRDEITSERFELREKASIKYNEKDFNFIVDGTNISEMKGLVMSFDKDIISRKF